MTERILFVFGAGASFGAGHVVPDAPPLGNGLYDQLAEQYPDDWGRDSGPGRKATEFREDFEKAMAELLEFNPLLDVLGWQRKVALFFSRYTPDGTRRDLYSRLIVALQDSDRLRHSSFASLNYECVFEIAAHKLGHPVDFSTGRRKDDSIPVVKIHGSCNFMTEDIKNYEYVLASANHLNCGMSIVGLDRIEQTLEEQFAQHDALYYSVLSFYTFGKDSGVAGRAIQEIRNEWTALVAEATKIVLIGVRPNREDRHIWAPLSGATCELFSIGADWKPCNERFEQLGDRFDEAFDALVQRVVT